MDKGIALQTHTAKYGVSLSTIANFTPSEFALLTPEALLEFCKTKLEGLDAQVKSGFLKQQRRNRLSGALSDLVASLNSKADKASGGVAAVDNNLKQTIVAQFDAAIRAAGGDQGLVKRLQDEKARFEATAFPPEGQEHNDAGVADWEMADFAEAVQNIQSDVNREGELEMIQLQSIMSQRQQALQMCTNMVQSLGQSAMGIAQNIGK